MNIKDMPTHLRPREKLINLGPAALRDKELLAILIRTGRSGKSALDIAQNLLKRFALPHLAEVTLEELIQVKGIDKSKACSIMAGIELTRRSLNSFTTNLPSIAKPEDALVILNHIRELKREHFIALYLNARNQLIHQETVSVGTLTASLVHPREVFAPALETRAASIILAHNHPSGDPSPSEQDLQVTEQLLEAGQILAIEVLDHLIVSKTNFVSMKQLQCM